MSYSYDRTRTAGDKIWHDIINEVQGKFCLESLKALVEELGAKGTIELGSIGVASGIVKLGDQSLELMMGFRGGEANTVFINVDGAKKFKLLKEASRFTPATFASYIVGALKEKGWKLP